MRRLFGIMALASLGTAAACASIAGLGGDFSVGDDASTPTGGEAGTSTSSSSGTVGSSSSSSSSTSSTSSTSSSTSSSGSPDSGNPDSGPKDSGADADATIDSGSLKWCDGQSYIFCWDFFGSEPSPDFGWGQGTPANGYYLKDGTLDVKGPAGDPTRHLAATVNEAPGNQSPGAFLHYFLSQHASLVNGETLTIRFEVQVTSGINSTYAIVGGLELGSAIPYGLAVTACTDGSQAACFLESDGTLAGGADRPPTAARFPIDATKTYQGQVTMADNGGTLTATVSVGLLGGALTQLANRSPVQDFNGATNKLNIIAGAGFAGNNATATDVNIDNVIATAK